MKILYGDILSKYILKNADAICFTSNGQTKKDGKLIMGAGNAKQFRDKFPGIDQEAGKIVKTYGNRCQIIKSLHLGIRPLNILAFPTKHTPWQNSDIELIRESTLQLIDLTNNYDWKMVCIPAPGVSHGRLNWEDVRKVIEPILDGRFTVMFLDRSKK